MEAARLNELRKILHGLPPQYLNEVLNYAKYLKFRARNSETDIFSEFDEADLISRQELSEEDIEAGRTHEMEDLKSEISTWKKQARNIG